MTAVRLAWLNCIPKLLENPYIPKRDVTEALSSKMLDPEEIVRAESVKIAGKLPINALQQDTGSGIFESLKERLRDKKVYFY